MIDQSQKLVSLFENALQQEPEQAMPLSDFLGGIKSGAWAEQVADLRQLIAAGNRGAYKIQKKYLPSATLSVHCLSREKDLPFEQKGITHTGWLQADMDLADNPILADSEVAATKRRELLADPYIHAVFVGPSGEGVKAVVAIPADYERHKAAWFAAEAYLRDVHGLKLCDSTKDPVRLCFASHDPDLAISEDFKPIPVPEQQPSLAPVTTATRAKGDKSDLPPPTAEEIEKMLSHIPPRPDYDTWLKIASAVWSVLPMLDGARLLHQWSPEEKDGEYASKHKSRLKQVGIGSLIHIAKEHGYRPPTQKTGRVLVASSGRKNEEKQEEKPMPEEFLSIVESQGDPFVPVKKGVMALNPMFVPALYAKRNKVLFDGGTRRFYEYNPVTGLWSITSPETIRHRISGLILEVGRVLDREMSVLMERSNSKLQGASGNLASLVDGGFTDRPSGFVHCTNGMLDAQTGELHPFSPDFKSRNATPFAWDEGANCPVFISELLASALPPEDIEIIQLYMGMTLMGRNLAQRILMLTGTAGGGKSTLCTVIEGLVGVMNCTESRTKHLGERFELARLVGKTLLTGKDVKGDFLMTEGAHVLKALSGGDRLETEIKNGMATSHIVGDYSIIITCNTRLRVRLDGDTDAWRRRLIKIDYERPKPSSPIPDFANRLLAEEGSGILKWAVDGAKKLLERDYAFPITPAQQNRVDSLLYESDALRTFVREQIEKSSGDNLTTAEIVQAFFAFCDDRGWASSSVAQVERDLPNAMMELHRSAKSSSIERQGKSVKGFRSVKLVGKTENGTDGTALFNPNAYARTPELQGI